MLCAACTVTCTKEDRPLQYRLLVKARPLLRAAEAFDPEVFLKETGLGRTIVELKKNQVLYSQGDQADAVFYIQKGSIKLTVVSHRGKEATLALLSAGNFA